VDRQQNVYVSDHENHRVMKWNKGAKEGIVVAGGQGAGNALAQLYFPNGIFVDTLGTLYVADYHNNRVMRWTQGEKKQGTVIVDGYEKKRIDWNDKIFLFAYQLIVASATKNYLGGVIESQGS
ncbi:unnamed protein product, partial [Rotaria socialis]